MINKFAQTFFTLVLIASIIACGQDEALTPNPSFTGTSSANQNTSSNGVMTADIAGNGWSGANISASRISGVINISGIASDNSLITLTLFDMGEGTYDISQVSNGSAVYQVSQTESYNAGRLPGEVIISEINTSAKTMSGTFSFKGENTLAVTNDTIEVSNGVFTDIPYITELAGGGNSNTLKATVDGVVFTASTITGIDNSLLGNLVLNGSDNVGAETIGLTVPPNITPGTYTLGTLGTDYYAQYNRSTTEFFESKNGQLVISKHDVTIKEIEGTFSFNAFTLLGSDSVVVTAGEFSVTY